MYLAPRNSWLACRDTACHHVARRPLAKFQFRLSPDLPPGSSRKLATGPSREVSGCMRQKQRSNEHPNVLQFTAALKHTSLKKLFNLTSRGNCEIQDTNMLKHLAQCGPNKPPVVEVEEFRSPSEAAGEGLPDILKQNSLLCFSGHLMHQLLKRRHHEKSKPKLKETKSAVQPADAEKKPSRDKWIKGRKETRWREQQKVTRTFSCRSMSTPNKSVVRVKTCLLNLTIPTVQLNVLVGHSSGMRKRSLVPNTF